ncbi:hypothetical protein V1525DRAFT_398092 [Lipomyces kononenkoae]|uniref:Uncharacterized protein n=1 Tax=Lipomyces kononenkoae TaxID=34357 RepID=A0ACC3T669_LIPKO
MSAQETLDSVIGLTRTILTESAKTFRSPPPSLLQPEGEIPTAKPNIGRTVGNIQIQASKLALARFSQSLNADAKKTGTKAADPVKALTECLNMIGALVALLVGEFLQTLREPLRSAELRYAVNLVVEERRARCINLCSALERLIDEVSSSPQAGEHGIDKKKVINESDIVKEVGQLSLNNDENQPDEEDDNDYQYVSAGIVISQCKQLQRFEDVLATSNCSVENVLRILVNDVRLHRNMITDAKNELNEFIEDPNVASSRDTWDLIGSEEEDEEEQEQNSGADNENTRRLLDLARLWLNKVNMASILLASLLKRRFVLPLYQQLVASDGTNNADMKFATFANGVTDCMKNLSAEIDEFAGGLLDGDDTDTLDEHSVKIKEAAVTLATLGSEVFEDEYCKWFVMFKEKFLDGI